MSRTLLVCRTQTSWHRDHLGAVLRDLGRDRRRLRVEGISDVERGDRVPEGCGHGSRRVGQSGAGQGENERDRDEPGTAEHRS
jgi:hypothetical protein